MTGREGVRHADSDAGWIGLGLEMYFRVRVRVRITVRGVAAYFYTHMHSRQACQACGLMTVGGT